VAATIAATATATFISSRIAIAKAILFTHFSSHGEDREKTAHMLTATFHADYIICMLMVNQ